MSADREPVSVVIPTLERGETLLETLDRLEALPTRAEEIVVVDQTPDPPPSVAEALERRDAAGRIRWIRRPRPSIPAAMNHGLAAASCPVVLFLDDDVVPAEELIAAHARATLREGHPVVAGQVLQPGETPGPVGDGPFRFTSDEAGWIEGLMAGNFSIRREVAIEAGGFDENFVRAAYRFETEFAARLRDAGIRIRFEPEASIRHLKAPRGGTRAYGHHLRTAAPGHAVGAYYYLLRVDRGRSTARGVAARLLRSVRTRHHLRRPWWIPVTLAAELGGLAWAMALWARGPRTIDETGTDPTEEETVAPEARTP